MRFTVAPMVNTFAVRSFSATPDGTDSLSAVDAASTNASLLEAAKIMTDEKTLDVAVALTSNHNFVIRGVMDFIEGVHNFAELPYWGAIVATTIFLRVLMTPIALKTLQSSARMAHLRPALQKVQDAMTKDANASDNNTKVMYQKEMQALFLKYKVNPLRAVLWPFFQLPIFVSFFMALRGMGDCYPGLATGGAFWFTDLTAADSTYILPVINSLSFLAMLELGADGVQMKQQATFKNVMRGLAVAMIPLTASMPQAVFVYWASNNVFSILQTSLLKKQSLREYFDIPNMPTPENTPELKIRNPLVALSDVSNFLLMYCPVLIFCSFLFV
jgi:YidC/Oxa1 family membrane protein insertase